jgi:sugar-specific transcriptional regulator TrmB
MPSLEEQLVEFGFSIQEARIYVMLLREQDSSAGVISAKTGINRRTTYDSLTRLEEKGFVGHTISANRQVFFAMKPELIVDRLKDLEHQAQSLLPSLRALRSPADAANVIIFKGRKGIRNVLRLVLESKMYVSFGSMGQFPEVMRHDFDWFQREKKERGIRTRTLLSRETRVNASIALATSTTKFRFLSSTLTGSTSTFIFNGKVSIFIWDEPLYAILIESENVFRSYEEYFEALWEMARP